MSALSLKSRLHGIDNDAKDIVFQGIRNGQTTTLADAFEVDKYVRNLKRNDAWKNISFFRDFASIPNLNPCGGPRITFSRASGATRVNQQGLIELMGANVPRFDYDPITRAAKGLLIEESRTNLILRSEEFDNVYWTAAALITSGMGNVAISPDGNLSADKIVPNSSNTIHSVFRADNYTSGTIYTISVFGKTGGYNFLFIEELSSSGTGVSRVSYFNLATGTLGTVNANHTAKIENYGNGWYRCSIVFTAGRTAADFWSLGVASTDNVQSFSGNSSDFILIWGGQREVGSFPTSYIPTTSATVTRSADLCSVAANFINESTSGIGSLYQEWSWPFNNPGGTGYTTLNPLALLGSVGNGQIVIDTNSGAYVAGIFLSSFQIQATKAAPVAANEIQKVVIAGTSGSNAIGINGSIAASNTNAYSFTGKNYILYIGNRSPASAWSNGHIRKIIYYSIRLPNITLQSITS